MKGLGEVFFLVLIFFIVVLFIFLKIFIYLLLDGEGGRKREGKTLMCGCLSHAPPTGDLAQNPSMCRDWN